jgi:hypothetical protein
MAIVKITMKSPDCLYDATDDLSEEDTEKFNKIYDKWIEYGEYLTIEIDTEKETCIVVPNKKHKGFEPKYY